MTDTSSRAAAASADPRVAFGDALVRTMRLLQAHKQHAPRVHPDVDPMSFPLLFRLSCQPHRVSDLADRLYADVSTVSRQVTHLAGLGLIERVPDPEDGRAHLLSLTDAGATLLVDLRRSRDAWLASLLEGWSDTDVADFAAYLQRFADAVDRSRAGLAHEAGIAPTQPALDPQDAS